MMEHFWKILVVIKCIYMISITAIDVATDITENDLNQNEDNGPLNEIFHSSFWTSKEIKVMTKNV